ncbi:glycerophosphodiester phosphodiesterase [Metapseudomonas boanensis]|uniref:Glycerophosphodiester phosphodiesterase n=1 Tax=Metapseudomonas boanensis TaxID=2822138 RepID=A0ABS5XCU8_9GAMM|nr:glycerophosphodiester phosphodiesterase [Pseudomonas boanensis]MBT8765520.1 glycerophosphodiester phosphodiesterase [Pseudomonas boanensis]
MKRLARFFLAPLFLLVVALLALALTSRPAEHPRVLADLGNHPLVIAHRGGRGLWPENTLFAFERASDLKVDMLEMDVRRTRDGELVVLHDAEVDRTTNGSGKLADLSLAEAQALDAGYRWSADGGESHPYRGQGIRIPTLAEVLERFPEKPKVVEIKVPDIGLEEQLCDLLTEHGQRDKALVGSFYERSLKRFREVCPEVATSAGPTSVRLLVALDWIGLGRLITPSYHALQIPEHSGGLDVATAGLMETAQQRGLNVQMWTINEQPAMQRLLDMGAHGLITDYPDRALQLLGRSTRITSLSDR